MSVKGLYVTKFVLKGGNVYSPVKLCGGGANLDMMFFVVTFAILRKWPARFLPKSATEG